MGCKLSALSYLSLAYKIRCHCAICQDPIQWGGIPDSMWHCKTCHHVIHYKCAKAWSDRDGVTTLRGTTWKCPQCQADQDPAHQPRCWCGRELFAHLPRLSGVPNACGNICNQLGKCPHHTDGRCGKICHPGNCDFPCGASCPSGPPTPPNAWDRLRQRFKDRKRGQVSFIVFIGLTSLVIYSALGIYLIHHIKWGTEPYNYPNWMHSSGYEAETTFGVIALAFILVGVILLVYLFICAVAGFLNEILALDSTATNPRRKSLVKAFGTLLLIAIGAGIVVLPCLG